MKNAENIEVVICWNLKTYLKDGKLKSLMHEAGFFDNLKKELDEHLEDTERMVYDAELSIGCFFESLLFDNKADKEYGEDAIHWNKDYYVRFFDITDIKEEIIEYLKDYIKKQDDELYVYAGDTSTQEEYSIEKECMVLKSEYRADVYLPIKELYTMLKKVDAEKYKVELELMDRYCFGKDKEDKGEESIIKE